MIENSEEIRELKQKLQAAYINKERMAQLHEQQTRKEQEIVRDALIEQEFLKNAEQQMIRAY